MLTINKNFQLQILEIAANVYPKPIPPDIVPPEILNASRHKLLQNVAFLVDEGLITGGIVDLLSGPEVHIGTIRATNVGVKLITEEGNISASLKVITIKFHDESIAALSSFVRCNVPDPDKQATFLQQIKALPAEGIKHISLELLSKGLSQIPDAIQWLETMLRSR